MMQAVKLLLLTILLVFTTSPIFAANGDWYLGVNFGVTDLDACEDQNDQDLTANCDNSDIGYGLFGGYQLTDTWGIEGGYIDLGEASIDGSFFEEPFSATVEVTGIEFVATGTYPITDDLRFFGKAGFISWEADGTASVAIESDSDDGTDLTLGIGIGYDFLEQFTVRGEYRRFDLDDADVDMFSIGVTYSF
ncbi:MAG: outer membrane beta-barrel protein [Gammaproteobacteria bacterium]|nr:outer membrane beta-barrel protein [Gammaproteobacteria bacterium]